METLTLGELITQLGKFNEKGSKKTVMFDFGNLVPTSFCSWRGSYDMLALNYEMRGRGNHTPIMTIGEFITLCEDQLNSYHTGWKGGEYYMGNGTPVWVDNDGEYTETALIGVKSDSTNVYLITSSCLGD